MSDSSGVFWTVLFWAGVAICAAWLIAQLPAALDAWRGGGPRESGPGE